jgi:hypothetical protein
LLVSKLWDCKTVIVSISGVLVAEACWADVVHAKRTGGSQAWVLGDPVAVVQSVRVADNRI